MDKFLRKALEEYKLASLYKIIRKGDVKVNGKRVKDPSSTLEIGDEVSVWLPSDKTMKERIKRNTEGKRELKPVDMDLDIIMEDEDLMAINKDAGISVHPGTGEENRATLIEGLMSYGQKNDFDPYLVHRLDRDTSGVLLISKKRSLARRLSKLIADKNVYKEYTVLFSGKVTEESICNGSIDDKWAVSRVYPLTLYTLKNASKEWFTLAKVVIESGRKHQIRRHLSESGYPVAGDDKYGNREINHKLSSLGLKRQFLHCSKMSFFDMEREKEYYLKASLKEDLKSFLNKLQEVD
jgi:23S rRNA pseudouridine955/2504/2580 synthase